MKRIMIAMSVVVVCLCEVSAQNKGSAQPLTRSVPMPTRIGIGAKDELKPVQRLSFGDPNAKGELAALAFSPDGRWLIGGGMIGENVGTLCLWDAKSGKLERQLKTQTKAVHQISFSANGQVMALTSGDDPTVRLWDATTWQSKRKIDCAANIVVMVLSPSGTTVATSASVHSHRDGPRN